MVHPVKVDRDGQFLSHSLAHRFERVRHKRDLGPLEGRVYYNVNYKGRNLVFNLTVNNYLVSNKYVLEWRNGSLNRTEQRTTGENACHLIGTVTDPTNAPGTAAISTCEGLVRNQDTDHDWNLTQCHPDRTHTSRRRRPDAT